MKAAIYLGQENKVGERVYPYPLYAKNDTKRAGTIGGFSEYILVPEAKRDHSLYAVPEEISDRLACLIEPFTVGCRAARVTWKFLRKQKITAVQKTRNPQIMRSAVRVTVILKNRNK